MQAGNAEVPESGVTVRVALPPMQTDARTCEAWRQCATSACSSPIVRAMRSRRLKLGAAREGAFHGGGGGKSLLLLPASLPLSPAVSSWLFR